MAAMAARTAKKAAKKPAKRAAKAAATTKRAASKPAGTRKAPGAAKSAGRSGPPKSTPFHATGRPRGRPPKIDQPSLCDPTRTVGCAVVDMVAAGKDPREAAALAGVFPDTIKGWLSRGALAWAALQADDDAPIPDTEAPFIAFFEEMALAEAHNVGELYDVARHYAMRDARWHSAYLTMRYRDRFGTQRMELTGAGGGPIRTQVEVWSLDKLEASLAVAESHAREQGVIDVTGRPANELAS